MAFGEIRCCLLLKEAILVTRAVPGATALDAGPADPADARAVGSFLSRLHRAGLVHGSLFARNLLRTPGGGFRLVDLDHAQVHANGRLPPLPPRARDLAFLEASAPGSRADRLRALCAYARALGSWLAYRMELFDGLRG